MRCAASQALSAAPPSSAADGRTSGSRAPEANPPLTGIGAFLFLLDQLLCALIGRALSAALIDRITAAFESARLAPEAPAGHSAPVTTISGDEDEPNAPAATPEHPADETRAGRMPYSPGKRRERHVATKPAGLTPLVASQAAPGAPGAAHGRDVRDRSPTDRNGTVRHPSAARTRRRLPFPPRDAPFAIPATPLPRFLLIESAPQHVHFITI